MTDPTPRPTPRRSSLGHTVVTVTAAAVTSAAVIWSALFFNASNKHASVAATASQQAVAGAAVHGNSAPAPVTTKTS